MVRCKPLFEHTFPPFFLSPSCCVLCAVALFECSCPPAATFASSHLNLQADPTFKTKGVVMVRGGIERYMRSFPTGGYWKGSVPSVSP